MLPNPPADPAAPILLVDDTPANLVTLGAVLGQPGYDLVEAASGREALRHLLARDFAVVLLDLHMPGLDGFETAQLIRDRPRSRHTPIIFVTADPSDFPVAEAYELGAVDYLIKPLVPPVLRAKVGAFVDLYRKTGRLRELERREADRRAEERFRALTENGADAVVLVGPDGAVQYASPSVGRVLGYDPAALVGKPAAGFVHPDDRPALAPDPAGRPVAGEARVRHADGSWRWAEGVGTDLLGHPAVGAVVVNFRDVTDRKRADEEREQLVARLRDQDRRKDEFLAMLAHELRNPLAPVTTAVHILQQTAAPGPDAGKWLDIVARQVRHMSRLVDDLLDVARVSRGKIDLRPEPVDLADVVRAAVETARPHVEKAGHRLRVDLPDPPVRLVADPARVAQAVANLLNNAAKYTEPGGEIEVTAGAAGGRAVVRVRDTGIGIPADVLPRVFDLFAQAPTGLARSQGGLGIGLALVKAVADLHGGGVEAHSDGPGRGSEFALWLPAADPAPAASPAPQPARAGDGPPPRRRVLIVEDNRDGAESLKSALELAGHEVAVAFDGPDGVAAARRDRPDVVVCDIGLPGLTGYDVARALRADPATAAARLIALSGYGQEEDRRRAREAGFDEALVKPVDPAALGQLVAGG